MRVTLLLTTKPWRKQGEGEGEKDREGGEKAEEGEGGKDRERGEKGGGEGREERERGRVHPSPPQAPLGFGS